MKIILRTMTLIIVAIIVIGAVLISNMWAPKNPEQAIPETSQAVTRANTTTNFTPLRVNQSGDIVQTNNNQMGSMRTYTLSVGDNPEDEVGYIEEGGFMITRGGLYIQMPDDAQSTHVLDGEFVGSAKQKLQIMINSMSLNATLHIGGKKLLPVAKDHEEVFLVSVQNHRYNNGLPSSLFVTKHWESYSIGKKLSFWNKDTWVTDGKWIYTSLAGVVIPDDWFIEHNKTAWWNRNDNLVGGVRGLWGTIFHGGGVQPVHTVNLKSQGTLAQLRKDVSEEIWTPFGIVKNVVTQVGHETIYIDTNTAQLVTKVGGPMADIRTGMPIISYCFTCNNKYDVYDCNIMCQDQENKKIISPQSKTDYVIIPITSDGKYLAHAVSYEHIMNDKVLGRKDVYSHSITFNGISYASLGWHDGKTWVDINGKDMTDVFDDGFTIQSLTPKHTSIWSVAKSGLSTTGNLFGKIFDVIGSIFNGGFKFIDLLISLIPWLVVGLVVIVVIKIVRRNK